jgi:hypothetical protein
MILCLPSAALVTAALVTAALVIWPAVARAQDRTDTRGHLWIEAPAGTELAVDGKPVGKAPLDRIVDVPPGDHEVTAKVGGTPLTMRVDTVVGYTTTARFAVADTQTAAAPAATARPAREAAKPSRDPSSSTAKLLVTGAAGAAAAVSLALGVGFGVSSRNHSAEENAARVSNAWASDLFYCVGGALAVGAAFTWFLWPKPSASGSVALVPQFSPAGAGLSVVWER